MNQLLPETTIAQAKRVNLLALAERQIGPMRKNAHHDWQGKCPKCGTDYFHVFQKGAEWAFRCYECNEIGDGIALMRWIQPGLTFTEAVTKLVDGTLPVTTPRQPERRQPATANTAEWRTKAARMLQNAQERLFSPDGAIGQEYLLSRGLAPQTWLQFGFGYRHDAAIPGTGGKERAPAIAFPWYAAGKLVGIRYRFFEVQNGSKIAAEGGSQFSGRLFGGHALPEWVRLTDSDSKFERMTDLVIVEGEINAASVWQIANQSNLCVLSMGSESAKLSPAMIAFAQRFRNVLFWADRPEVAHKLQDALPGANSVSSPDGKDANDLLKDGTLGAYLALARLQFSKNAHDREGVLWDLHDGSRGCFDDEGTRQVVAMQREVQQ